MFFHLECLLFKYIYFKGKKITIVFFNEENNRTSVPQTAKILKVVFERQKLGRPEIMDVAQQEHSKCAVKQSCCHYDH